MQRVLSPWSRPFILVVLAAITGCDAPEEEPMGASGAGTVDAGGTLAQGADPSSSATEVAVSHFEDAVDDDDVSDFRAGSVTCQGINLNTAPENCTYERWNTNQFQPQAEAAIGCGPGRFPISGGCWTNTDAHLLGSMPWEAGSASNGVNDNQDWRDGAGWSCRWDAPAGSPSHYVFALCCDSFRPVACD